MSIGLKFIPMKRKKLKTLNDIELPNKEEKVLIIENKGTKFERKIKGVVEKVYDYYIRVKIEGTKMNENFLKVSFLVGELEYEKI